MATNKGTTTNENTDISINDIVRSVVGEGASSSSIWVGRRRHEDNGRVKEEKTQKENTKENSQTENVKYTEPPQSENTANAEKANSPKRQRAKRHEKKSDTPARASKNESSWLQDFVRRLDAMTEDKDKGERTRVIRMPDDIINTFHIYFGRRAADVLSLISYDWIDMHRDELLEYLSDRITLPERNKTNL